MSDLISRQAAIEINQSYHGQMPNEVNHRIWKEINELPSVQETHEERTETHGVCLDVIDRQAAIDALNGEINITGRANAEAVRGYVRLVKDRLERLPSAQPAPCEFCKHNNMADDKACLMCSAERRTE